MSSFDTPKGTRSARVPPMAGPIGRWLTKLIVNRVRKKGRAPGLETAGKSLVVTAEQLHGAERDAAWQQITTAAPRFKS